jgi:hypothetical protein
MSNSLNLIDIYKINVFPSFSDDDYNIQLNEKKLNSENEIFDVFSNENFQFLPKEKFILQKKEINFQIINKTKEQNKNINNNNNKIFSLFIETPTLFDINRSYSKINQIKINNSNNKKNFFSSSLIKPINLKPFSINATKKTNNNNNFNNNFNTNINNNINNNNINNNNRNEINSLSNIEIKNKLLNSYNSNLSNIKNTNNEEYFNTEPSLISNNFINKENNNNLIINNNNNINYNKKHKNKLFQYLPKLRSKSQNKIDNNNNNNYNKKIDIRSELLDLDNQYESVKKDLIEINP